MAAEDFEYRKFARIHKYENPSDVEKGKVNRETACYVKSKNRSDRIYKRLAKESDGSDEGLLESCKNLDMVVEKDRRNAKVHKQRLKKLQKNKKFI